MNEFEKYKNDIDYKCPVCNNDFSVEDSFCQNCKTDLYDLFSKENNRNIKNDINHFYPWKLWEILITLLIYYIVLISFNKHFLKYYILDKLSAADYLFINYLIYSFANIIFIILTLYFIKVKRNLTLNSIGLRKYKYHFNDYYSTLIIVIIFSLPILLLVKYLKLQHGIITDTFFSSFEISNNYLFYMAIIINMFFLEPLANEIFFRSFFYNKIKTGMNYFFAAIIVSIIYSALSNDFIIFIIYFFLSLFFCINFQYKLSIIHNVFIKICINLIFFIFFINNFNFLLKISFLNLIWFAILSFLLICIIDFYRFKKKKYAVFKLFVFLKYYTISFLMVIIIIVLIFKFLPGSGKSIIAKDYYYSNGLNSAIIYLENINEFDFNSQHFLAELYYKNGEFDKSLELLKELQKKAVSKENRLILNNLIALNYTELNINIDIAYKMIVELYNYFPYPVYYKTLGWLNFKMGNVESAERIINEYINYSNERDNSEIYYHAGILYYEKENFNKAKKFFIKSYKDSSENYFGRRAKQYLEIIKD